MWPPHSLHFAGCWHAVPAGCPQLWPGSPRKILRLKSKRGQENGNLDKILHAFAYESWHNSNSQKSKLGPHRGLAVPFVPSVAAHCSQAHSVASCTQGDCRTLCHATSELNNHGRKKGNIAHQQKPWETILLLAKLCRSLFGECTSREMQLLTVALNRNHPENEGSFIKLNYFSPELA